MGADSQTKTILCAKTPELIETAIADRKPEQSQTDPHNRAPTAESLAAELSQSDSTLSGVQFEKALQTCSNVVHEAEVDRKLKEIGAATPILPSEIGTDFNFKREIVWKNVVGFLLLHICGWVGLHLAFWRYCDYRTTLYSTYPARLLWVYISVRINITTTASCVLLHLQHFG